MFIFGMGLVPEGFDMISFEVMGDLTLRGDLFISILYSLAVDCWSLHE